ncbi:MAG: hypothetical protein K0R58_2578 [Ramlibacter sp.]|jgi:hypothetical protein|nr:hypothetical protein [Ramlibacter sp.]
MSPRAMLSTPLAPAPGRFLHLIHDEKFIEAARGIFEEAAPGAHDFLVIGGSTPLRHIRTFAPARLELDAALQRAFLSELPLYAAVFVHYLGEPARLIVARAPSSTRFVWLGWGADYYHLIASPEELLLPRTRSLAAELALRLPAPPGRGAAALGHAAGLLRAATQPLAALRRFRTRRTLRRIGPSAPGEAALINTFRAIAMPIEEDYAAMRARHPLLRVPFLHWNYWTEGFRAHAAAAAPSGNNILLGNSATPAGNHLDVLERLCDILPPGRAVICPLSYGDARYGDAVEEAGRRLLGSRFIALRDYMDPAAYSEVIASCSIVLMNHVRQQALGNIILALSMGAHVFLHAKNPIQAAMRRLGVPVHDIDRLAGFVRQGEPAVGEAELQSRRSRLEDAYGRPAILRRTHSLLGELRQGAA